VTVNYVSSGGCAVNADSGFATYLSFDGIVFRSNGQDAQISTATSAAATSRRSRVRPSVSP
jgi:hypothetical protein